MLPRDFSLASASQAFASNGNNSGLSEFGLTMALTASLTRLLHHVGGVFFNRAEEEVARLNASPIVAAMTHAHPRRYRADVCFICVAVYENMATGYGANSVAVIANVTRPFNAAAMWLGCYHKISS